MSDDFNRGERVDMDEANRAADGLAPDNSSSPSTPNHATQANNESTPTSAVAPPAIMPKQVEEVMNSDIGISTLLNRLKQSIASARDFATFLKKRSALEEEQATGIKRLVKSQMEAIRRVEGKSGSYAQQLAEVMRLHERLADNGMQFALSLHQMHEDLNELSANMERGRKQWKHEGLDAEKRASDAEAAMHKAKARYDGLAEDYDRARTGDTKGSRRIGLKGPKSAEQYEQDLLRKTEAADKEYEERVRAAQLQRSTLISSERPNAVKAIKELIHECDSALSLQLQKFAAFNEKLLLGNGLAVAPLNDKEVGGHKSLRDIVYAIDNDSDFIHYVGGYAGKIPARPSEIKYEQHPTLAPKTQPQAASKNVSSAYAQAGSQQPPQQPLPQPVQQPPLSVNTSASAAPSQMGSVTSRFAAPTLHAQQQGYTQSPQNAAPSFGQQLYASHNQTTASPATARDPYHSPANYGAAPVPYPLHPSERNVAERNHPPQHPPNYAETRQYGSPAGAAQHNVLPPLRPVFGVSLDDLFERDQSAVPVVVIQCILAIDTFGLDVEGIYRLSGTASHINTLKTQFDHNAAQVDFRNPAAFFHDVNSVATLLKQFFRELPDPLFTRAAYTAFIDAARIENADQRRDALHQAINELPDANYATLRALVLHLHRVILNETRNRMGANNLALCFAPTLMGAHTGAQIADASLQARVVDTILNNATAIFDED